MKAATSHLVGEVHQNGIWIWSEYKPGRFDWRAIKGAVKIVKAEEVKEEVKTGASKLEELLKNYTADNTPELFWAIYQERINTKGFRLTPPQKEIVRMLQNGHIIVNINEHHLSGGDWTWDGVNSGGKIYKAFWNTMRAILRGSNEYAPKGFIVSERAMRLATLINN